MAQKNTVIDAWKGSPLRTEDYGKFKVYLADSLTTGDIAKLCVFFQLKPAVRDDIRNSKTPGLDLILTLESKDVFSSQDISNLVDGLQFCNLDGVVNSLQQSFPSDTSQQHMPLEGKKQSFVEQLKTKYKTLCDSVKPVPYIKDKKYCVNDIYVEGEMQILVGQSGVENTNAWSKLESYDEILESPKTVPKQSQSSKRKVIEGEPGFGKSTLTLQFVHDWLSSNPTSPLKDVEILIFLRFRQLSGIKSIYKAIKVALLPRDTKISESEIEDIIQNCESVVIILDGYDEYSDKDDDDTDFFFIIGLEMFQNIEVIITTRKSILPPNLTATTTRIKLSGFGEHERRRYILKVVAPSNESVADRIEKEIRGYPVVEDLCEVPLFFTMVAHIAYERNDLEIFSTATKFFRFIIECFHGHIRNKEGSRTVHEFEEDHRKLDQLAFEGLCSGTNQHQQIAWEKSVVIARVGQEFCNYYMRMGMLIEEEVLDLSRPSEPSIVRAELRLPHKILCEWYATHQLVFEIEEAGSSSETIEAILSGIDPLDLQYLCRFACGLNKKASEIIIKHLQKTQKGKQIAVLCMIEQDEKSKQYLQTVRDLVSTDVIHLRLEDTKLLQRSTIQILAIASENQIPISEVFLLWCFRGFEGDRIRLKSGLVLSSLSSVRKISINGNDEEFTDKDVAGLVNFGMASQRFSELWFLNCKLPRSINPSFIKDEARSRDAKVMSSSEAVCLDMKNGDWERPEDFPTITLMCSGDLVIDSLKTESEQRSVVQLLEKASSQNIPIHRLTLTKSYVNVDEEGNIILCNDISLPILPSLVNMDLQTERETEITQEELLKLLQYLGKSESFQKLRLYNCELSSSIQPVSLLSSWTSRKAKFDWYPNTSKLDERYRLDLTTGVWLTFKPK